MDFAVVLDLFETLTFRKPKEIFHGVHKISLIIEWSEHVRYQMWLWIAVTFKQLDTAIILQECIQSDDLNFFEVRISYLIIEEV